MRVEGGKSKKEDNKRVRKNVSVYKNVSGMKSMRKLIIRRGMKGDEEWNGVEENKGGEWRVENGEWRMEDGGWRIEDRG